MYLCLCMLMCTKGQVSKEAKRESTGSAVSGGTASWRRYKELNLGSLQEPCTRLTTEQSLQAPHFLRTPSHFSLRVTG